MRILGDVTDLLITTFNPNLGKGPGLAKNYLHVEIRGIYSSILLLPGGGQNIRTGRDLG